MSGNRDWSLRNNNVLLSLEFLAMHDIQLILIGGCVLARPKVELDSRESHNFNHVSMRSHRIIIVSAIKLITLQVTRIYDARHLECDYFTIKFIKDRLTCLTAHSTKHPSPS